MRQILLYSKYSANCKQLLDAMERLGANISTICIDNKEIRNRIIGDKRLNVRVVPTLLALYDTGVVEKYEGPKVMELLTLAFEKPQMKRVESQQVSPSSDPKRNGVTNIEDLIEEPKNDKIESAGVESVGVESVGIKSTPGRTTLPPIPPVSSNPESGTTSLLDLDLPEREVQENLPVRASNGVAAAAAKMAEQRDQQQAGMPRGKNDVRPDN